MKLSLTKLRSTLKKRFGGVLKSGSHQENGEACALELFHAARKDPWGDQPYGIPDLRELNDAPWSSSASRTEHVLPVLAALSDWDDWTKAQHVKFAEIVALRTVRDLLPPILRELKLDDHAKACEEAKDLASAARAAASAASDAASDAARAAASAARAAAWAASDAARAAAWAASDAAWAASDAARAAAWAARAAASAASDAASDAARAAASAASDAAWAASDAARAAAWAASDAAWAASDAASDAARAAAWAAWDAARAARTAARADKPLILICRILVEASKESR